MAAAVPSADSTLTDQTLDNTLGAILLGAVCASMLFGITTIQALWYYHSFKSDSRVHKFSVAILWALDAFDLALVVEAVYTYVVHGFQNVGKLGEITWSIKLQVVVNVVVVLFVHSLYASRVWLLGGYHQGYLGYVVAITLIAGFGVGVILAYKVYTIGTYPDLQSVAWAINTALASQTATDFLITAAMCYYLSKSKGSITGFNMRISTVIQFTLSSGLLCTACSLATLFTYILSPNTFIFLGLEFLLTQFYVGSFIAMLNSRERPQSNGTSSFEGQTTSLPSWQRPMTLRPTSTICHMPEPPNSANSVEMLEAKGLPAESTLNLSPSRHSSYYHAY